MGWDECSGLKGRVKGQGGERDSVGDAHEESGERVWDRYVHMEEDREEPNQT